MPTKCWLGVGKKLVGRKKLVGSIHHGSIKMKHVSHQIHQKLVGGQILRENGMPTNRVCKKCNMSHTKPMKKLVGGARN